MKIERLLRADTLEEAYEALQADKANTLLGGGVWLKQLNRKISTAVDITRLGLDTIEAGEDVIDVGAMVTLRDFETHPAIAGLGNGFLVDCTQRIMSVALRNVATVGGSVIGRFGFSDFLTALSVLDVTLVFYPLKKLSLEAFLHGREKPTGILTNIVIRNETGTGCFKKNANTLLDFARLNLAVFRHRGGYRIAVGARPGVAKRAHESMAYLQGRESLEKEDVDEAATRLVSHVKLGSNNRASADYRKTVAQSYLKRALQEVNGR